MYARCGADDNLKGCLSFHRGTEVLVCQWKRQRKWSIGSDLITFVSNRHDIVERYIFHAIDS